MVGVKKIKIVLSLSGCLILCLLLFCNDIERGKRFLTRLNHRSDEKLTVTEIDTNEFPPGFPTIRIDAVNQLKQFPLPRFQEGHHLLPNFLWMDPNYIGNSGLKKNSPSEIIKNSTDIQFELASDWNYYLQVSTNISADHERYNYPNTMLNSWIKLANDHPELPTSAISFWVQMKDNHIGNQKLGNTCYLRDEHGNFITDITDHNGVHRTGKLLSPGISLDTIALDGIKQRHFLEKLLQSLKRPLNCINEEDEIFTIYDSTTLKRDPFLVADKNRMKINNWDTYQAEKRKAIEITYRDSFMILPQLKNTIYSVYGIDGHTHYRSQYSVIRKINTPINNHYYPTPDFYPRYPWNWKKWSGPWHGLSWIFESRPNELAVGDSLYSPFVAAGWDSDPVKNICPAQWLGLLKLLAMTGAEFYYTGFFNERPPFPAPETYIWQAAMPGYAQAITSRYENIFRKGEIVNPSEFVISAGDDNMVVIAKKLKDRKIYAITGTIQNNSNKKGDTPLQAIATITLDGTKLKFEVRRQGSTYIFNAENQDHPVFYQLDGWHESGHPSRWSKDFNFEAELFDNKNKNTLINTELSSPENKYDFSNFASYVSFSNDDKNKPMDLQYSFSPRDSSTSYTFEINARSQGEKTGVQILLDGKMLGEIKSITKKNWEWINKDSKNAPIIIKGLTNHTHTITLVAFNNSLEVDKFHLKHIPSEK